MKAFPQLEPDNRYLRNENDNHENCQRNSIHLLSIIADISFDIERFILMATEGTSYNDKEKKQHPSR